MIGEIIVLNSGGRTTGIPGHRIASKGQPVTDQTPLTADPRRGGMSVFLQWRPELERVLALAAADSDQWVSMLAELLHTFPASGSLNTDIGVCEENRDIFVDLVDDLKELSQYPSTAPIKYR